MNSTATGHVSSYNTIVAAAKTAVFCTTPKTNLNCATAILVLIDAGCEHRGYAGDITRCTFPVNGNARPQREIYDIVLESLETAAETLSAGHLDLSG